MNKFKVGDEVVRIHPSSKLVVGETYVIKEILSSIPAIILEGYSNMYNLDNFELAELDYRVVDTSEILTPLQVAEAFLNEKEVQGLSEDGERWYNVTYPITLSFSAIQNQKFRLKPKTIVINGVEVPAPLDTKSLGYPDKVYGLNFSRKSVCDTIGHTNRGLFWATEEDAQQVLDAMLIPFNQA